MTMAHKRQGNRFTQPPRLDDPLAPTLFPESAEVRQVMPAGRNFR
jgi:hypothetical protein